MCGAPGVTALGRSSGCCPRGEQLSALASRSPTAGWGCFRGGGRAGFLANAGGSPRSRGLGGRVCGTRHKWVIWSPGHPDSCLGFTTPVALAGVWLYGTERDVVVPKWLQSGYPWAGGSSFPASGRPSPGMLATSGSGRWPGTLVSSGTFERG